MILPLVKRLAPLIPIACVFAACGGPSAEETIDQANQALDTGQPQQAIGILEDYSEDHPENVQVVEQLAFASAQNKDPMMAAFYFNQAAELAPDQPQYLLYAAQSLSDAGDYEGAINNFQKYLEAVPSDGGAWIALGELAAEHGHPDVALNAYNRGFAEQPSSRTAARLGDLYLRQNNLPLAAQWFNASLKQKEGVVPEALMGQLELAIRNRDYPRAEQVLSQLQQRFPGTVENSAMADVPTQLANWREKQNAARQAAAALRSGSGEQPPPAAATDTSPTQAGILRPAPTAPNADAEDTAEPDRGVITANTVAVEGPGLTKESAVNRAEAQEDAIETVEGEGRPVQIRPTAPAFAEARAARDAGDLEEAARLYSRALVRNPSAAAWNAYSEVSEGLGNSQQAFAASLEAMRLDPDNLSYALQYLKVAQTVYTPSEFLRELVRVRQRFPNSPDIMLALARAYWRIDRNARNARALYDEFIERAPNHPLVSEARSERAELARR